MAKSTRTVTWPLILIVLKNPHKEVLKKLEEIKFIKHQNFVVDDAKHGLFTAVNSLNKIR